MPAKGARREKRVAGDKSQPNSLGTLLVRYLESLTRVSQISRTELERFRRQAQTTAELLLQ
jgi:hypothetical protein